MSVRHLLSISGFFPLCYGFFPVCHYWASIQYVLSSLLHSNLGQVVHTYVPLSPSSITWYQSKDGDILWLERWPQAWWKVMTAYCWWWLKKSPAGWLPVHWDPLRAQCFVTSMGELYSFSRCELLFVIMSGGVGLVLEPDNCSHSTGREEAEFWWDSTSGRLSGTTTTTERPAWFIHIQEDRTVEGRSVQGHVEMWQNTWTVCASYMYRVAQKNPGLFWSSKTFLVARVERK